MKALALAKLGASILVALPGCTGRRHVLPIADPPPAAWDAAISFFLTDSTRVEFFDGRRTRIVYGRDRLEYGRETWYPVRARPTFSTTIRVTAIFPGHGTVTAEYPLTVERGSFYTVSAVPMSDSPSRRLIGAQEPRSYPMPPGARREPSDSLWVFWSGRTRDCWTCPN
jgi:hypothetical protein